MPQRSRINLFARLLLEIRIARFFLVLAWEDSLSMVRKHSGMLASIEGVVSGSKTAYSFWSDDGFNSIIFFNCRLP